MTPWRRRSRISLALGMGLFLAVTGAVAPVAGRTLAVSPYPAPLTCRVPDQIGLILTPTRRENLQRRLDRLRERDGIPGISAAIILPDGSTWTGTSGLADVAAAEPVVPETAFAIASISKTFTAALILALHEEGRVDLEAPVVRYLPTHKIDKAVTVHELLDHTSGLSDFFLDPRIDKVLLADRGATWTSARALRYMGKPYFKPGAGWHYSNTNYLLLGLIAEHVTRRPLAELLQSRFFTPLGLAHTYEQIGETPLGPVAHGYRFGTGAAAADIPIDLTDGTTMAPFTSVVTAAGAAGSVASTAVDLAHWIRALYGGSVLRPATLAAMIADVQTTATKHAPIPYGLGVQALAIDGYATLGHSGRLLGFRSVARYLPDEQVAIVVLTNQSRVDPTTIVRSLLRLALTPILQCPDGSEMDLPRWVPPATKIGYLRVVHGRAGDVHRGATSEGDAWPSMSTPIRPVGSPPDRWTGPVRSAAPWRRRRTSSSSRRAGRGWGSRAGRRSMHGTPPSTTS